MFDRQSVVESFVKRSHDARIRAYFWRRFLALFNRFSPRTKSNFSRVMPTPPILNQPWHPALLLPNMRACVATLPGCAPLGLGRLHFCQPPLCMTMSGKGSTGTTATSYLLEAQNREEILLLCGFRNLTQVPRERQSCNFFYFRILLLQLKLSFTIAHGLMLARGIKRASVSPHFECLSSPCNSSNGLSRKTTSTD